ncbi:MAG TPA: CRISPR-associated endonuclease Cas2 [Candidatus Latescibacteria bacterium]|nr:CRISPR-associated endonuclease Cas2 [Candidatus Latescibacterota bacterium]
MFVVVSYDIVDDRTRVRVMKCLKNYGMRVQKSVFECLITEGQFLELKARVQRLINADQDSVRYYDLCARCQKVIEFIGEPPKTEEDGYVVI